MRLVVADASPVNYLILIDCIDVLRRLYARIVIPHRVYEELGSQGAPAAVASWIQSRPDWVDLPIALSGKDERLAEHERALDLGELEAIRIALAEPGSLRLIDESAGRAVASRLGIDNTGTLGVLLAAAGYGWIDLGASLARLRQTNFRVSQSLIERLLETNRDKI